MQTEANYFHAQFHRMARRRGVREGCRCRRTHPLEQLVYTVTLTPLAAKRSTRRSVSGEADLGVKRVQQRGVRPRAEPA